MNATALRGLLREPPLALLAGTAVVQLTLLLLMGLDLHAAGDAFLAGPIAILAGLLALLAFVHTFALARRAPRRLTIVYVLFATGFAGVGLAGPLVADPAREAGALRAVAQAGPGALRLEALAILEKYRHFGLRPAQVSFDDWGPALRRLGPVRVIRFPGHLKLRLYGLEAAYWSVWLMEPGYTIDAMRLDAGVYWVRADEFGYMFPVLGEGTAPVGSAAQKPAAPGH